MSRDRKIKKHCDLCKKMFPLEDMVDVEDAFTNEKLTICYQCAKEG